MLLTVYRGHCGDRISAELLHMAFISLLPDKFVIADPPPDNIFRIAI